MRVVVLGAGFGGLELTTRLSDEFGADVEIVLIDRTSDFVFGFSKLEVMFPRARDVADRVHTRVVLGVRPPEHALRRPWYLLSRVR